MSGRDKLADNLISNTRTLSDEECSKRECSSWVSGVFSGIFLMLLIFLIYVGITHDPPCGGDANHFTNKSDHGYLYQLGNLQYSFASAKDRRIGKMKLTQYLRDLGYSYTSEQIESLADSAVLNILEADDDDEARPYVLRLIMILNPLYREAATYVDRARKNSSRFVDAAHRQLIYDLLQTYFTKIGGSVIDALPTWSDVLLLNTFRSLRYPPASAFGRVPSQSTQESRVITPRVAVSKLNSLK